MTVACGSVTILRTQQRAHLHRRFFGRGAAYAIKYSNLERLREVEIVFSRERSNISPSLTLCCAWKSLLSVFRAKLGDFLSENTEK